MLVIVCPYCGKRPEIEFSYGGQAHLARPAQPAELDDQAWAEFLYMRSNTKGLYAERWRHSHGCGRYFNALRDTTTDHFSATYPTGAGRPQTAAPTDTAPTPTDAAPTPTNAAPTPTNAAPTPTVAT